MVNELEGKKTTLSRQQPSFLFPSNLNKKKCTRRVQSTLNKSSQALNGNTEHREINL